MRSVTHMFDSVIAWFTPQRRKRLAVPLEIATGSFFALVMMLDQAWRGGFLAATLTYVIAAALGAGVALHRSRPEGAVIALAVSGFLGLFATVVTNGAPTNGFVYLASAIVLFGSSAYGSTVARWIGLALSAVAVFGLLVAFVTGSGMGYPVSWGFLVSQGIWLIVAGVTAMLPWLLGELVRNIRNRRALSAAVETASTARDAALTRADLEAERTRVARDVHDIVAHSLTVVIAQADGARYATTADSPAAADAFGAIAQTARDALADVRTLLTELRHTQESGPQPGLANLDALFESFRDSGLELTVHEFGDRGRLTDARELALYRIVQESLTNALRHGDGRATLDLDWGDAAVDLLVTNEAAGAPRAPVGGETTASFDGHTLEGPQRGHGIDGMRERSILAGGEFSIHDGATYRVRARLPREPLEHARAGAGDSEGVVTEVHA